MSRFWLSGGTGFVGGRLAELLREDGHDVVALARPSANTSRLRAAGAEIAKGDITDKASVVRSMDGCDGGFHVAAWYEVGVGKADRDRMFAINVGGTRTVLEAATETGLAKLVYCSTCGALGPHAPGELPAESAGNTDPDSLGSYYNESKYAAHVLAEEAAREGVPIVTVMPGGIYGPKDTSVVASGIRLIIRGVMVVGALDDGEFTWVHVDDVARGHILALEKGKPGEEFVLGGQVASMKELLARAAIAAGRKPPRFSVPTGLLKAIAPISGPFTRLAGFGPRFLKEGITSADGKSFAYSHAKTTKRLGYRPRSLDEGLPETVEWFREQMRATKRNRARRATA
ncbi:MAG: NAD-dependent epimerase/dehydratase family protein [Actinomycetota bacterium]